MTIRRKHLLETIERWVSLIALKIQNQEKFDNIYSLVWLAFTQKKLS